MDESLVVTGQQNTILDCHPERSEGSAFATAQRLATNDYMQANFPLTVFSLFRPIPWLSVFGAYHSFHILISRISCAIS